MGRLRGSDAWKAERERAKVAANEARAVAQAGNTNAAKNSGVSRDTGLFPGVAAPSKLLSAADYERKHPAAAAQKPTWERDKIAALVGTSPATVSPTSAAR